MSELRVEKGGVVEEILVERHNRLAIPFSTFILTLIGVSISARKIRGGVGLHIGIGIFLSFTYILFMQFSSQFAIGGLLPVMLAVWLPNIIFGILAAYLYWNASKQ